MLSEQRTTAPLHKGPWGLGIYKGLFMAYTVLFMACKQSPLSCLPMLDDIQSLHHASQVSFMFMALRRWCMCCRQFVHVHHVECSCS
jgi:hypothetical protein